MKKAILVTIVTFGILVAVGFSNSNEVSAQTTNYIWQALIPKNVNPPANLKDKLELEVNKVISAGHLAPFRAMYGETEHHYFWYNRFDTVYTLSLAYPYVSSGTQNLIKTYLQSEMSTYPLWTATYLDPQVGTRREPNPLTAAERGSLKQEYNNRPKLFAMYALWLYAYNTGNWSYIESNWNSIKSFYTTYKSETGSFYSSIAGAIGVARMAEQKATKDTATRDSVITDINNGLNSGKNLSQFTANAENAFKWTGNGWDWTKVDVAMGFHYLNITPEIGRYMYDDQTLRNAVLGTTSAPLYTLSYIERKFPTWFMAQSPSWNRYFGESTGIPLDTKAIVFPLKAWVQKQNSSQLTRYVDVPDALVGDYYFMQNLTRTIQSYGEECWQDVRSTGSCQTVTQPTFCPADINQSGFTDIEDYGIMVNNFFLMPPNYARADVNGDGLVDIGDYTILAKNYFSSTCL